MFSLSRKSNRHFYFLKKKSRRISIGFSLKNGELSRERNSWNVKKESERERWKCVCEQIIQLTERHVTVVKLTTFYRNIHWKFEFQKYHIGKIILNCKLKC